MPQVLFNVFTDVLETRQVMYVERRADSKDSAVERRGDALGISKRRTLAFRNWAADFM